MKKELKLKRRGAGILLPISSLPSPYGIGTFGEEAYRFVDQLVEAKQKYWQVLPVGPTSYGDSPYQSFSAFSGNPYFIDLDILIDEGLLEKNEVLAYNWGENESDIDYATIYQNRFKVLRKAFERSNHKDIEEYKEFCAQNTYWLDDYSLYMAVKCTFDNQEWSLWEESIRNREPEAVAKYQKELKDEIDFWKFCQYKFHEQWKKLKQYANMRGVKIIGDIPLYVAMDSADVWVHGRLFELDERKNPINVAGVPPDAFSDTGQRWGNPLYDWKAMEEENFCWWRERMKTNAELYDIIRIDHFIGVVRYYSIPVSCPTAQVGKWRQGPGAKLTDAIKESIGDSEIIAEDLGLVVPSVRRLIKKTGWPGMKILEFGFDGNAENDNLPHNYKTSNCIVYGGTHDNETLVGFFEKQKKEELNYLYSYLNIKRKKDIPDAIIRLAYASIADTAIFQMQDILHLDNKARMNLPGTLGANWRWRMKKGQFTEEHVKSLAKLVGVFGRE
ncbi:4-alpha-glucanotransferase [Velocimicrobium porci]|uniref:4-alpha-glucanotransferase n=1 Tax=Velocimicrobium porci TaxID=2606634 RepID=A0A6L5XWU4_9FIRM|nr:4-alpha-glucanotransferase [Velocimicrobium porci]MSS63222.1 4-alpha-glucanotransferase [Velocimicrobium porci]